MNDQKLDFGWHAALQDTYRSVLRLFTENFPLLLGALAILLIGIAAAYLSRYVARKLTLAAASLLHRYTRERDEPAPPAGTYGALIGNIVFWSVLLFFAAAGANLLEWQIFARFLGALLAYLPNLFAGLLIVLAGFILAGIARALVETTAATAGMERPALAARIAQVSIVVTALIVGVDQFGIDITFLTTIFIVVVGVLLFGAALAFALGARAFVANLIAARLSRQHYRVGQWIRLPQAEGMLVEITPTELVLDNGEAKRVVPASLLQDQVCEIRPEQADPAPADESGSLLGSLFRKRGEDDESV